MAPPELDCSLPVYDPSTIVYEIDELPETFRAAARKIDEHGNNDGKIQNNEDGVDEFFRSREWKNFNAGSSELKWRLARALTVPYWSPQRSAMENVVRQVMNNAAMLRGMITCVGNSPELPEDYAEKLLREAQIGEKLRMLQTLFDDNWLGYNETEEELILKIFESLPKHQIPYFARMLRCTYSDILESLKDHTTDPQIKAWLNANVS